jgi:twitching motility protein PilT
MRDLETIRLAITAAETGHLVLSTLHSPSAPQSIDRIIDVYPPAQQVQVRGQLADCLLAVITQTLLPRRGGGRVCAAEVLVAVPAARALIRDAKTHQLPTVMQVGQKDGMQTMDAALVELVHKGFVAPDDAAAQRSHGAFFKQEGTE